MTWREPQAETATPHGADPVSTAPTGKPSSRLVHAGRAYLWNFDELLIDLGRVERRVADDAWTMSILDRIRNHLESIDATVWPCAADLVAAGMDVDDALAIVDRRVAHLRREVTWR